jgi:hypothetical protein
MLKELLKWLLTLLKLAHASMQLTSAMTMNQEEQGGQ